MDDNFSQNNNNNNSNPQNMTPEKPQSENPHNAPGVSNTPKVIAGIVVVLILGALAYYFMSGSTPDDVTGGVTPSDATVVAEVNGKQLLQAELNDQVRQLTANVTQQGVDVSDPTIQSSIQEQALDTLINIELLVQEAKRQNVEVQNVLVEQQFNEVVANFGGEEAFAEQIRTLNLTEDAVKENIRNQLAIKYYLSDHIGAVEVTEAEARALYDEVASSGEDVPPYEEVSEQVIAQVRATKEQGIVEELLNSLREQADIQIP